MICNSPNKRVEPLIIVAAVDHQGQRDPPIPQSSPKQGPYQGGIDISSFRPPTFRPAIASIIAILPPQIIPSLDLRQPSCQVWEIGRVSLPSAKICLTLTGLLEAPEDQSDNRVTYLPAQRVLPRYDSPLNLFASKHH
jgi:hypothetical protein